MTPAAYQSGTLLVGAIAPETEAEGPGRRFALWLQGCSIRCAGCCNPHLFETAGGSVVTVGELLDQIEAVRARIEGITFLGGEPFDQAGPAAALARGVHKLGLSVVVFTGFRLEELRGKEACDLISAADVVIDGRYEAALPERERRWVGSTNQRFHYNSSRYGPEIERPMHGEPLRSVEVELAPDGRLRANGWPALVSLLRRRR